MLRSFKRGGRSGCLICVIYQKALEVSLNACKRSINAGAVEKKKSNRINGVEYREGGEAWSKDALNAQGARTRSCSPHDQTSRRLEIVLTIRSLLFKPTGVQTQRVSFCCQEILLPPLRNPSSFSPQIFPILLMSPFASPQIFANSANKSFSSAQMFANSSKKFFFSPNFC